jgi:hypothetical protein
VESAGARRRLSPRDGRAARERLRARLHAPTDESGDFKTIARLGEDFGLGLRLNDEGRITLN